MSKYLAKKHPAYKYKSIIDYFVYLKDDELYNEFPQKSIIILQEAIFQIKKMLNDENFTLEEKGVFETTIEEGKRILRTTTYLEPIAI